MDGHTLRPLRAVLSRVSYGSSRPTVLISWCHEMQMSLPVKSVVCFKGWRSWSKGRVRGVMSCVSWARFLFLSAFDGRRAQSDNYPFKTRGLVCFKITVAGPGRDYTRVRARLLPFRSLPRTYPRVLPCVPFRRSDSIWCRGECNDAHAGDLEDKRYVCECMRGWKSEPLPGRIMCAVLRIDTSPHRPNVPPLPLPARHRGRVRRARCEDGHSGEGGRVFIFLVQRIGIRVPK
ncbi:hypothetical protein B0H14DRAFT_644920 [Mycena olivaceomarginata]|nr:hypothetical protein B0H14DRAFT_644920 [Mycena olivaceomarginata]